MAGTEENTLVLGESNIIVKVCVSLMAPWCSGYHSAQLHSTKPELSLNLRRVGDSWWWGSKTMVSAGNKAKRLSSVNHTTIVTFNIKTIRIQSSMCSYPVKLSFSRIRSLRFINQPNFSSLRKPWWSRYKKGLCKNFCFTFSMSPLSAFLTSHFKLFHLLLKWSVVLPTYCLPQDLQLNR